MTTNLLYATQNNPHMEEILKRNTTPIRMRNYGRILQDMIAYASSIEDQSEREALTVYIAQCMRQKNYTWNKDQDAGLARVKEDIIRLSDGKLNCDFPAFNNIPNTPNNQCQQGGQNRNNKNKNKKN